MTTTRSLRRRGLGLALAALALTGLATACEPTPPGCSVDCIGAIGTNPGATKVTVTTTVKAKVTVQVFATPALTGLLSTKTDPGLLTTRAVPVAAMKPGTAYGYKITAIDAQKRSFTQTGSFVTKSRTVKVVMNRIRVDDVADADHVGELVFHERLNGLTMADVLETSFVAGADTNVNVTRTVLFSAPNPMGIAVEARESDGCFRGDACWTAGGFPTFGAGHTASFDWNTATAAPVTFPVDGNGSGTWTAATGAGTPAFQVWGTWTVTYS